MATVRFTKALKRFFPTLGEYVTQAKSLKDVLKEINLEYPGIIHYILDEQGDLRKHVNIFIDGDMIMDRTSLGDAFQDKSEIYIIQALSGG